MTNRAAFALLICSTLWLLVGCSGSQSIPDEKRFAGAEKRVFEVFGMDCPGCHGGVEKLVNRIPGVQGSRANWEKKELVVYIDPSTQVSDEDIIAAIKEANFTPGKRLK